MGAYNGYDYDMGSALLEMDSILLEAGERPVFVEADTGTPADPAPDAGAMSQAVCDWLADFVNSDDGWGYLAAKRRSGKLDVTVDVGGVTIHADNEHEKGSPTNSKALEVKDGEVFIGPRKLMASILSASINELMEQDKDSSLQSAIVSVIRGDSAKGNLNVKFKKAIGDFISGKRPKPAPQKQPQQQQPASLPDRVWAYLTSDDATKNSGLGADAKNGRNDGAQEMQPDFYGERDIDRFIQETAQKDGVAVDPATVTDDDKKAILAHLQKVVTAVNELSSDEMSGDDATVGKYVTAHLTGAGNGTGKTDGQGENGDENDWAKQLWKFLLSDNQDKNRMLGQDCHQARKADTQVDGDIYTDDAIREYMTVMADANPSEISGSVDSISSADVDACRAVMGKVPPAMNRVTPEQYNRNDAELGAIITQYLTAGDAKKEQNNGMKSVTPAAIMRGFEAWYFGQWVRTRDEAVKHVERLFSGSPFSSDSNVRKQINSHDIASGFANENYVARTVNEFKEAMKSSKNEKVIPAMDGNVMMAIGKFFSSTLPARYMKLRQAVQGVVEKNPKAAKEWEKIPRRAAAFVDNRVDAFTTEKVGGNKGGWLEQIAQATERVNNSFGLENEKPIAGLK